MLIANLTYLVPANSPTVAIQGLAVPGTATNPIVIEEDYAPLGSARNPIMVHVKEGYNYSGIPTLAPTKSPVYGHPERSQAPRESYVNHALSDYESTSHGYRKDGSERGRFLNHGFYHCLVTLLRYPAKEQARRCFRGCDDYHRLSYTSRSQFPLIETKENTKCCMTVRAFDEGAKYESSELIVIIYPYERNL